MAITFPASWQSLKLPEKRAELLEYLAEIIRSEVGSNPSYQEFDIDEIVHFLFDDTDAGVLTESTIGLLLFDSDEAALVRSVTIGIDNLLKEIGDEQSQVFLAHPGWPEIQLSARKALEKLRERGVPQYRDQP